MINELKNKAFALAEENIYKEVAEKEGVSIKTIERRITIATSVLRKYLRDYIKLVVLLITGLQSL